MNPAAPFDAAADRVRRRLALAGALALAERWALPALGALCAGGAIAHACGGALPRAWLALAVAGAALAAALAAWLRRPGRPQALALWDAAAGRRLLLASAWWFLRRGEGTPLAQLHCARAATALPQALPALGRDLPLPRPRRLPAALALLAALLAIDPFHGAAPTAADRLDAAAVARARSAAKELAAARLDRSEGLADGERKRQEEINRQLAETAKKLAEAGQAPRELLADLDRLARAAEALAAELAGDAAALQRLAAALDGHADLAALAEALRKADHGLTAAELEKLAAKLEQGASNDERRRLAEALAQATAAAGQAGQQSAAGQALARAQQALAQGQGQQAAQALRAAAAQHQRQAQRQAAGQQMQQLASRLRQAGAGIAGRQSAASRLASSSTAGQGRQRQGMAPSTAPLAQQWRPPSAGQRPGNGSCNGNGNGQRPGSGSCSGGGGGRPPVPGSAGGGGSPVPGQQPGRGAGAGQAPVPGAVAVAGMGAGRGGTRAGHGSVAMGRDDRRLAANASTSTVEAPAVNPGESQVRETIAAEHKEAPTVALREAALGALTAEEEAIDIEHVPLARRGDLLRYFTAVRTSLEQGP